MEYRNVGYRNEPGSSLNFEQQVGVNADQTCMIIVADFQGKLVSAYPATKTEAGLR